MQGTGQVQAGPYRRKRRQAFLHFMQELRAGYPAEREMEDAGRPELHVILDNYGTHKPKQDRWVQRHPHVPFHFTPTPAAWLNR